MIEMATKSPATNCFLLEDNLFHYEMFGDEESRRHVYDAVLYLLSVTPCVTPSG